jgi:hypothetical protein
MAGISKLETGLLAKIFSLLSVGQQAVCACVNTSWRKAVAVARTSIECNRNRSSLVGYLTQHPGHVQTLLVRGRLVDSPPLLSLPLTHLTQLQAMVIRGSKLQCISSPVAVLPALRRLELEFCSLDRPSCLLQLAANSALTSLKVRGCFTHKSSGAAAVCSQLLQHLQQLVELELGIGDFSLNAAHLQQIASMT